MDVLQPAATGKELKGTPLAVFAHCSDMVAATGKELKVSARPATAFAAFAQQLGKN
jgi:hypothetical protein